MARVSKRLRENQADKTLKKTVYKTAIYGRISDDGDQQKIESVENQFFICKEYIEKKNKETNEHFEIVGFYGDYGKTGSNFERDEFQKMLEDVRLGIVNCIVVKDASRFGRNHIEVGNYIERIFPFLGVRFIAVTDGIDTFAPDFDSKEFASEIKNLINEMYSKDAAIKANASILQKRQMGSHVGGRAPYGYHRVKIDGLYRLIPDEKTRFIVKDIFELFVELKNYSRLSLELQRKRLNIPTNYFKTGMVHISEEDSRPWSLGTLKKMIRNEAYIGHWVPGDVQYRRNNAHEAIIDVVLFEKAQEVAFEIQDKVAQRKMVEDKDLPPENVYYDVLYCGVCGSRMIRSTGFDSRNPEHIIRRIRYYCYKSKYEPTVCYENIYISKANLDGVVLSELCTVFANWLKRPAYYKKQVSKHLEEKGIELKNKLNILNRREQHLAERQLCLYQRYIEKGTDSSEYLMVKDMLLEEYQKVIAEKEEIERQQKILHRVEIKLKRFLEGMMKYKTENVLSKAVINSLIEKIQIYPDKRVEIVWSFTDEWSKGGV